MSAECSVQERLGNVNVGKDVVFLVHTIPWGVNNEVCQENEARESRKWDVSEC